jgi:hypothetical protein
MLLCRHQNVGQNRDTKIANGSFGSVSQIFSPDVKNLKIVIYKTIILPVVPYGCET